MRTTGKVLDIGGTICLLVTSLLAFAICLEMVYRVAGFWGVVVGFAVAPVTFLALPWYALFAYGELDALLLGYGGLLIFLPVKFLGQVLSEAPQPVVLKQVNSGVSIIPVRGENMETSEHPKCFFCGRSVFPFPMSAAERATINQSQFINFSDRLAALEHGEITIELLCKQIANMCGICQTLMVGISSRNDSMELQERIRKEMQNLHSELTHVA